MAMEKEKLQLSRQSRMPHPRFSEMSNQSDTPRVTLLAEAPIAVTSDPTSRPISRSSSIRRLHQVKHSVAESTRSLATAFERVPLPISINRQLSKRAKTKEEEAQITVYQHNPIVVYGRPDPPPTKMETYIQKSKTFSSIVGSVKRLNIRPKPKVPPNRDWDSRGKEPVYIPDFKRAELFQWTEEQIAHHNEQQLVALTPHQLRELQGKSTDTIIYANPTYMVPPPTPCGSDAGSVCGEDDDEDEERVFGRPEDEDPEVCILLE
jgi:hypothetical protein